MSTKENAATLKHSHIHLPTTRNVRDWLKKPLAREIEIDTALIAFCSVLLGWTFFSLVNAFQSGHVIG
jgi:hypothetical protein